MAKQDFDLKKFTYQAQEAAVKESEARLTQARAQREQTAAQLASTQKRIAMAQANLVRFNDVLQQAQLLRAARRRGHQPPGAGRAKPWSPACRTRPAPSS